MTCSKCGTEVTEGSAFCSKCGAPAAPATVPAPAPAPSLETELWKGRFSARAMPVSIGGYLLLSVVFIVVLVAGTVFPPAALVAAFVAWAILGIVLVSNLLYRKGSIRYRLTTERLFFERGIFTKETSEMELVRVDDVSFSQNVIQRLFHVGTVAVQAVDSDTPRLHLEGIQEPEAVKEMIRNRVKALRRAVVNIQQV